MGAIYCMLYAWQCRDAVAAKFIVRCRPKIILRKRAAVSICANWIINEFTKFVFMPVDRHTFHISVQGESIFLCLAEKTASKKFAR